MIRRFKHFWQAGNVPYPIRWFNVLGLILALIDLGLGIAMLLNRGDVGFFALSILIFMGCSVLWLADIRR